MDKRRLLNTPGMAERIAVAQENEQIKKKLDEQVNKLNLRIKGLERRDK